MILNTINSGSASSGINLKVIGSPTAPENPKEGTIWVETTNTTVPQWWIQSWSPNKEIDIMGEPTTVAGYIKTDGSIAAQQDPYYEVYNPTYYSVSYGTTYYLEYQLTNKQSMWLAVIEYTGNQVFSTRNVLCDSSTNNIWSRSYTPSSSSVTSIRLSWRTFNDTGCKVLFYQWANPEVGSIWVQYDGSANVNFSKKNYFRVFPGSCQQYTSSGWVKMNGYVYRHGAWYKMSWTRNYYYYKGDSSYEAYSGGWSAGTSSDGYTAGTPTFSSNKIACESNNAWTVTTAVTNNMIDFTGIKTLYIVSPSGSYGITSYYGRVCLTKSRNGVNLGAGTYVGLTTIPRGACTVQIDTSNISGKYYIMLEATGGASGRCAVDMSECYGE